MPLKSYWSITLKRSTLKQNKPKKGKSRVPGTCLCCSGSPGTWKHLLSAQSPFRWMTCVISNADTGFLTCWPWPSLCLCPRRIQKQTQKSPGTFGVWIVSMGRSNGTKRKWSRRDGGDSSGRSHPCLWCRQMRKLAMENRVAGWVLPGCSLGPHDLLQQRQASEFFIFYLLPWPRTPSDWWSIL